MQTHLRLHVWLNPSLFRTVSQEPRYCDRQMCFLVESSLLVVHHQLYITSCTPPVVHHQLYTTSCTSPVVHHQLYITSCTPPGVHHQLYITSCCHSRMYLGQLLQVIGIDDLNSCRLLQALTALVWTFFETVANYVKLQRIHVCQLPPGSYTVLFCSNGLPSGCG